MTAKLEKIAPSLPLPKPGILDISPYQQGKSKAAADAQVIKLSSNENPLGPSEKSLEAFRQSSAYLHRYPDGGATVLREAISAAYSLDTARIVCGAGSDELIGLLIHAYAGAGDEVLYSRHGFLMYKIYTLVFGATPVTAAEKGLRTDIDALLAAVTPRTKIVFVANPNNPTGSYISKKEIEKLRADLPPHIILAIDAAYAEYVEAKDYSDGQHLAGSSDNTIMLRTFSKIHALSALRLGWAYGPPAIIDVLNRIRSPFNVSTPAAMAGVASIQDAAYIEHARRFNKEWVRYLSIELAALGLIVFPSVANFVLVRFPGQGKTAKAAAAFLMERGIIPREVTAYGLSDCLRISVGLEEENRAVVAAISKFLHE